MVPESGEARDMREPHSLVAYRLDSLPETVGGHVLVVGFGNAMKAAVKACDKAFANPRDNLFVTGSDDKERAFTCGSRATVASVGPSFDKRLFGNAHAIMTAARACDAKALLLADAPASDSLLLRMIATRDGMLVLAPVHGDKSLGYWVGLNPQAGVEPHEPDWRKCPHCKLFHDAAEVMGDGGTCPTCGGLYRLNSDERIALTFDPDTFQEWDDDVSETDPLDFPDYDDYLARGRSSGFSESVRTGSAQVNGYPLAFGIMESAFMMGSMGFVCGEKLARMVERATSENLPVVIFTSSGGARMQEGLVSLMQMAKVSVALEQHARACLPYIVVITDPTTGGVTASFAMQGDIVLAEPKALVGFAGQRVIRDTIRQELPEDFQTAEFALQHGLVDAIVQRSEVREHLATLLALHARSSASGKSGWHAHGGAVVDALSLASDPTSQDGSPHEELPASALRREGDSQKTQQEDAVLHLPSATAHSFVSAVLPISDAAAKISSQRAMRRVVAKHGTVDALGGRKAATARRKAGDNAAWESVQIARNVNRPTARFYIECLVDDFVELHGDRAFADDGAVVGGVGFIGDHAVTVIAEEKGATLKDRIARNFGCPQPEGYRKARRLMQQAEKFGRPVLCFVDTQGAFCGTDAEERGQGNAIAESLMQLASLTVPVVSVILGEGGSGGALALALANRVAMQEHAVYSVLSPEGFASILWKDRSRAPEAAAIMKMSAAEACKLGIVEEVLLEGAGPAHENPDEAAVAVAEFVHRSLEELCALPPEELRAQRHARFRAF